jgi:glycosyltransferase involved in cell wall biosynthesis
VRILYLADTRFPIERANGIQTMETCHALARRGHEVLLAVRGDTHEPSRDACAFYGLPPIDRLTVVALRPAGGGTARRVSFLATAVSRALGSPGPDIVFTRDLTVAALLTRVPAAVRPPVVFESHGFAPSVRAALPELLTGAGGASEARRRRLRARERRVWEHADGYVAITAGLAGFLTSEFGARDRLAVVPDAARVPEAAVRAAGTPTADTMVVGYAGHLYPWKGVDVLVRALGLVHDADAVIVGGHPAEPDLARVRALASELGLAGRITFTGLLAPGDVSTAMSRVRVAVVPNVSSALSDAFTSPLKLFEYMAAGKAIVASDLPSIREVLRHEENALLAAPGDPEAVAAAIRRLRDEPALRDRLGRQARADAALHTWDRRAERIEALLETVRRDGV